MIVKKMWVSINKCLDASIVAKAEESLYNRKTNERICLVNCFCNQES